MRLLLFWIAVLVRWQDINAQISGDSEEIEPFEEVETFEFGLLVRN